MFIKAIKLLFISLCFVLTTTKVLANALEKPAVESFESSSVLQYYQHNDDSQISLSKQHYKFGQRALLWQWQGNSRLSTQQLRLLTYNQSQLKYGNYFPASPTFLISLYSEQPQTSSVKISFEKNGDVSGKESIWFDLPLNFSGWRIFRVPFYEMNGQAPEKNAEVHYDTLTFSTGGSGQVFIDDIIFSQFHDDRHPYPSAQTPFMRKEAQQSASDHWMPLLSDLSLVNRLSPAPLQADDVKQLLAIEDKITAQLISQNKSADSLASLKRSFTELSLVDNDKTVQGPPLTFAASEVYYNKAQQGEKIHTRLHDLGLLLKKLALHHSNGPQENQSAVEQMFIQASRYYLDQGWQAGSSMGTLHHIGYSTRELTEAFYLMRKPLQQAGLLNDIGASLQWIFNLGKLLGDKASFHANIDYMNTQSFYHLLIIFLSNERAMQAALLQAFSDYISIILAQDDSHGVFKIDGTAWHHGGHYPAYALGAFEKVPQLIYSLSASRFSINEAGHSNFKKAFLASRIYSQPFDFGFGNAGRHPFAGSFSSLQQQYLQLALSGNPQHTDAIDKDVAGAYLRLWGKQDQESSRLFKQYGISAETLTGYYSFPYAATAVLRQKGWAAIIKGYSKYVWASEIYVASNRYGRYPANGTVQLLNEQGERGSGFVEAGWDWNRFPGATVINLPIEQLETTQPLLMFKSDETFVGSVQLNNNGLFAMQLNESKGANHEGNDEGVQLLAGELKAKKSVFAFNNKLIFIGTDISSRDNSHPVQTNLFQSYLTEPAQPLYSSSAGRVTSFPYQATLPLQSATGSAKGTTNAKNSTANWLIDPYGNGYHLLSDTKVTVKRKHQHSLHNKYALRTGKMNHKGKGVTKTQGDFASAWLEHGIAPENGAYQYAVYPFMSQAQIRNFAEIADAKPSYDILQADSQAHIVVDHITNTTAYALFSAKTPVQHGILASSSAPALVMVQQQDNKGATLSIVEPNLNFSQEKSADGFSQPVTLTLTLNGHWQLPTTSKVKSVIYRQDKTEITLTSQHGLSVVLNVQQKFE
ncbi:chondroitinase family polysaccharide lyase [Colwellia psychrerythraea]|uniref:Chondroitin-sulfate-ABC endolyase n=1 Tax=Colwellia psychrerythraea TaxID=28229 RepID=A0A099KD79_COLPS|nr:chondroitinase family polysaccharide lyase [Colwellia psychrerythraea]KGJ88280.1 Chondroitin-sulfate-ABC endolyase [Colwellia psychrerythraea]